MSDRLLICHDDGIHMHCAKEASRSDVLEWLGWEECEEPYCGSFDRQGSHDAGEYVAYECPNCLSGLVPPASQVEAAARAMYESGARAALIAAMREGVGHE